MKTPLTDDTWEDIAQEAIRSAERVDCSLEQFADGLEEIADSLRERARMARDEIKSNEARDAS